MRTEIIFTTLLFIGLCFKALHWPGGNIFIILAVGTLALLYFPFGFFFLSDKSLKNQNLGMSIITGMMLSVLVCSISFTSIKWPGGGAMFAIGAISTLITLGVTLSLRKKNTDESLKRYYDRLGIRQVFFLLVGLLSFFSDF